MRVLFISTRLAGTDGVSLEAAKMRLVFEQHGHEVLYCAGELEPGEADAGQLLPLMHFTDPIASELGARAFASDEEDPLLLAAIEQVAESLLQQLRHTIDRLGPGLLVVQNAWAIPMQLPLAVALGKLVAETQLPTIAHNHDYWWERERFARCSVPSVLQRYFPFDAENVSQLSINTAAKRALALRRGIESIVLPNVMDFEQAPPGSDDDWGADFRQAIGVPADRPLILQPTRVVPRKGIELAIDLCAMLADLRPVLVITHEAGDEGLDYLRSLQQKAAELDVDLRHVADRVADQRSAEDESPKRYGLWDTYPHADLVTYPSLYEGFGNALLEAVWFRKPVVVNRYSVYVDDIAPKGFDFVEIDGAVQQAHADKVRRLLPQASADARSAAAKLGDHNLEIAREHFSYAALARVLQRALSKLGLTL